MNRTRLLTGGVALLAGAALMVPMAGQASHSTGSDDDDDRDRSGRAFVATDNAGNLLRFTEFDTRFATSRAITGLPAGVSLVGIDYRPKTGELYGVGSNSVVYRVNPDTAIATAVGAPFTPALSGTSFGVDFNPVPDRIRVTSNTGQNLRLNPDTGAVAANDAPLNPGTPMVVGSAYTNSSFSVVPPTSTTLYALDAGTDSVCVQSPPNNGTLVGCKALSIDVTTATGFDIAGAGGSGYVATRAPIGQGSALYTLDVTTGRTRLRGSIAGVATVITGLAAVQDQT